MASVVKVREGEWEVRYRTPEGGSRRKRGFPTKREAARYLHEIEHKKATGAYIEPGKLTFGEYAEQWRANQVHRGSTAEVLEIDLRLHILPQLGPRPIGSIRPSDLQAWAKGRLQVLSVSKVKVLRSWVGSIFRAAVLDDVIRKSPCVNIRLPKIERKHIEPLATEAIPRMAAAMPERYRALVILAAGSGLRQGEVFGLTLDRVNFLRRELTVDRQLAKTRRGVPEFGPPKTDASYRTVPLGDAVLTALSEHIRRFPLGPKALLFTNNAGHPILRNNFGDIWHPARKAAGLPEWATSHDLRHYYASLLIQQGLSPKVIQARLGHASITETFDTYGHLWPEDEESTRRAVDEVLGAALADFVSPACHEAAAEE